MAHIEMMDNGEVVLVDKWLEVWINHVVDQRAHQSSGDGDA